MDIHVKLVMNEMTRASDEERITFPEVVMALMRVGVERYHADLVCANKTYYMPNGDFEAIACNDVSRPAQAFSAEAVEAAVRAIQAGNIKYREFCARIAEAGCVGYFVNIAGAHANYYGRKGESHLEWFPGAPR